MPHHAAAPGRKAELDIRACADEVIQLFQQQHPHQAVQRLEALRHNQVAPVQEALDRYVSVGARDQLASLRTPDSASRAHGAAGLSPPDDAASLHPTLARLEGAAHAPSMPEGADKLSEAQRYDVYASIVAVRGNDAARAALETQDRVILGLRNETQTTQSATRGAPNVQTQEHRGTGVYDDRMVVLWKDANGSGHVYIPKNANTDPTAQYDAHAASRQHTDAHGNLTSSRENPYKNVVRRHGGGEDVNGDGVADLGRLAEGTTEMLRTTHHYNAKLPKDFSLRPSPEAIRNGAGRVERDTNGDGWFDSHDANGVQALNNSFKIHRGSMGNTDSAGCQTVRSDDYQDFTAAVTGHAGQTRWQYVLTSVAPSKAQQLHHTAPAAAQPSASAHDPRLPHHPDHTLQQQIHDKVAALGGRYAEHADAYSLSLLYHAKQQGLTRVDMAATSNAVGERAAGEFLFLVQGQARDPAALRATVPANEVQNMPVQQSLQRLEQQATQAKVQTQAQQPPSSPVQDNTTPFMRGP